MIKFESENVSKEKWMPCPSTEMFYPTLAHLYTLDTVIIVKKIDALHGIIGVKHNTCFTIYNNKAEKVFLAVKDADDSKLDVKIYNSYGNEVIHVEGPKNKVLVWSPPGRLVGTIEKAKAWSNDYNIRKERQIILQIVKLKKSPKVYYDIIAHKSIKVGSLMEKWDVDTLQLKNFGVSFAMDLDVGDKAALVGACFMIACLKSKIKSCCF